MSADLQLYHPESTMSTIHPSITNTPDLRVNPDISSENPGSEAQKATILSVLGLCKHTAWPLKNKCPDSNANEKSRKGE